VGRPIDIKAARRIIAKGGGRDDWTMSKAYELANGAKVHDVLTEKDGAPALEHCLPHHARFAVAAMKGWPVALDRVELLERLLGEALAMVGDWAPTNGRKRGAAMRKEAGLK
jgi:hypothetical protein